MNTTPLKQDNLKQAEEIATLLIKSATKHSENNWSWFGMKAIKKELIRKDDCSLYIGTAGVVYFLFELFKETKTNTYKEAAQSGINHIIQVPSSFYQSHSYLTGSTGVACLLAEWGTYFDDPNAIQASIKLVEESMDRYIPDHNIEDYINGNAGVIHGLLKYQAMLPQQQTWITPILERLVERIIQSASFLIKGLCWDRTGSSIKPLCGFSHGASGFGYLFLELGNYYKNENFYWLAKEAFEYEDTFFNSQAINWPDFRNGGYDAESSLESEEYIHNKNKGYFTQQRDHGFAWCHGGPGVVLSRLRALELINPQSQLYKKYSEQVNKVGAKMVKLYKAINTISGTKTLCHGEGGMALIFLDLYRFTHNPEFLKTAQEFLNSVPKHKEHHGDRYLSGFGIVGYDEPGLFMGYAGIGYTFLKLYQNGNNPSILRPDVAASDTIDPSSRLHSLGLDEILNLVTERTYPNTKTILGKDAVTDLLKEIKPEDSMSQVMELIAKSEGNNSPKELLSEALALDAALQEMDKSIFSFSYLSSLTSYHVKKNRLIAGYDDRRFDQLQFTLREFTRLYQLKDKEQNLLIYADVKQSRNQPISSFTNSILTHFQKPNSVSSLIEKLTAEYEIDDVDQLKVKCRQQIKEVLQHGLLIVAE